LVLLLQPYLSYAINMWPLVLPLLLLLLVWVNVSGGVPGVGKTQVG
jgi:hypothetical protein